jgi:NitT/TauT family transport system ATP-binding protein
MQPPLVQLVDAGKTFPNGVVAADGASLELAEGEFVSLLGPSGCGKSTVLRLIAGLSRPSRGVVRRAWDGTESPTATRQPTSCVFQEPTLMPWASVWDNVYLPLRLAGVGRGAARGEVDEAIAMVGLGGFADMAPRQLSGGMKMRASIARALATRPRLVLLDEPFAALDEITRQRLNDELLALWRERRPGVLFVTHSVLESVYLSNRVLVMSPRPGRIVEEITIDLPAERRPDLRTSSAYHALCRRASAALERAMSGAA